MLFNEPKLLKLSITKQQRVESYQSFSALQRAEIAEMGTVWQVSANPFERFSALQRAEIAEIGYRDDEAWRRLRFQCSSTSRNC